MIELSVAQLTALVAVGGGIFVIYLAARVIHGGARFARRDPNGPQRHTIAVVLAGLALAVAGVVTVWLGLKYQPPATPRPAAARTACGDPEARHGVVIDAGSSGSRVYIYCWKPAEANRLPWVQVAASRPGEHRGKDKVEPGLSAASDPDEAGRSLQPLLDFALDEIGSDPRALQQTPLQVMATAGMRLLPEDKRSAVVSGVKRYLDALPAKFQEVTVEVISGEQEAVFAWLAANALVGFPKPRGPFPTLGIVELGGASTQIAFPASPQRSKPTQIEWGSQSHALYATSYLRLGRDEVEQRVVKWAKAKSAEEHLRFCYPRGYAGALLPAGLEGTGGYALCSDAIRRWLKSDEGKQIRNATVKPETLPSGVMFLALSNFYYTDEYLKMAPWHSLGDLDAAGRKHCQTPWGQLREASPKVPEKYLAGYCFSTAYAVTLLTEVYGFGGSSRQILSVDRLHGDEVSWTRGAMIYRALGPQAVRWAERSAG